MGIKNERLPILEIARIGPPDGRGYVTNEFWIADAQDDLWRHFERPVRLGGSAIGFCLSGGCVLSLNLKTYEINEGDMFFITPGIIVQITSHSDDFTIQLMGFTSEFIRDLHQSVNPLYPYIIQHSKLAIDISDRTKMVSFFSLMREKALRQDHFFNVEIIKSLLQVLFYEVSVLYWKKYPQEEHPHTRHEEIFKRMMRLILHHYKEERTVAFYARTLCLTPKYLSAVVKEVSNRTVTEWINETVILNAKTQLKSSQMTIQEVANYLNFPNPSFFGRFFKKHTGMTPKAYRQSELGF